MSVTPIKRIFTSVGLSLLTAILSLIILFAVAHLLGWAASALDIGSGYEAVGEGVAYVVYDVFIAGACFLISRRNPKSIWYAPVLCNAMGIIPAFIEPNFWTTSLWIFVCGGWVLSIAAALFGAKAGHRRD